VENNTKLCIFPKAPIRLVPKLTRLTSLLREIFVQSRIQIGPFLVVGNKKKCKRDEGNNYTRDERFSGIYRVAAKT
jgi:hypothetical protein